MDSVFYALEMIRFLPMIVFFHKLFFGVTELAHLLRMFPRSYPHF